MATFLCGLWAVRADRPGLFALALVVGALDNETTLVLPAVYWLYHYNGRRERFWPTSWRAVALAAPAFLLTAAIRYATRDRPHLGGAWHLPDNMGGIGAGLLFSPLDYWRDDYLFPLILFGPLWVYAYLGWAGKPPFVRADVRDGAALRGGQPRHGHHRRIAPNGPARLRPHPRGLLPALPRRGPGQAVPVAGLPTVSRNVGLTASKRSVSSCSAPRATLTSSTSTGPVRLLSTA